MNRSELNRRDFISINTAALGALVTGVNAAPALADPSSPPDPSFVDVDFKALVSTSDLHYLSPVDDSSEGHPIGNGRMGTMVWTTPSTVQFQINRVDVFAANRNYKGTIMGPSDKGTIFGPSDFCGACGAITVEVGGTPFQKSEQFHQQLSLYGAENQIRGQGVHARCFVSSVTDVLVLEIDDQRPQPTPLTVTVSLWGTPVEKDGEHVSSFEFLRNGTKGGVSRKFVDANYYCRSAIAVNAPQGKLIPIGGGETTQTFQIKAGARGKTVLHISSAASMTPKVDVVARAVKLLDETASTSYTALHDKHQAWWSKFWARTFVSLSSSDTVATFMQQIRNLHLYLMASTSRGAIATKWNGMLFTTKGDERSFGAQYWGWTMEPIYAPLYAAGASDLADPYLNMHVAQLPQCRIAAAQRWNAKGAWFPEICPFDGPRTFPDDVAREYRDLLFNVPNRADLSERARSYGRYDITLCDFLNGPTTEAHYTSNSHVFATGPRIAQQAWWRYRHTGDTAWLRTHGYPLLQGTAEFYRTMVKRGADGRYHLERSGMYDGWQGVKDGIVDIAAIRAVAALAIRASEILNVDADLRTAWRDLLANLAPFAMGHEPEAKALGGSVLADDIWAAGRHGDIESGWPGDVCATPIYPFENYTLETPDPEMARIAGKVVDLAPAHLEFLKGLTGATATPRIPITVARVGHGEELPAIMASYYTAFGSLPNGFSTLEQAFGQGPSAEVTGMLSATLQDGLMQSVSPSPGGPEVIRMFPAWPKGWDATFSLQARGGFLVTSSIKDGVIAGVEITSQRGEMCRIRNPWKGACFLAERGKSPRQLSDDLIQFKTRAGATYALYQHERPRPIRIAPAPKMTPTSYAFTLASGFKTAGTLGRNKSS